MGTALSTAIKHYHHTNEHTAKIWVNSIPKLGQDL